LDTVNAACPGETSTSFISSVLDNGCGAFRARGNVGIRKIATTLGVGTGTVQRIKADMAT
jgi:hypothetical protein